MNVAFASCRSPWHCQISGKDSGSKYAPDFPQVCPGFPRDAPRISQFIKKTTENYLEDQRIREIAARFAQRRFPRSQFHSVQRVDVVHQSSRSAEPTGIALLNVFHFPAESGQLLGIARKPKAQQ